MKIIWRWIVGIHRASHRCHSPLSCTEISTQVSFYSLGGREGGKEGEREGGKEGGREGGRGRELQLAPSHYNCCVTVTVTDCIVDCYVQIYWVHLPVENFITSLHNNSSILNILGLILSRFSIYMYMYSSDLASLEVGCMFHMWSMGILHTSRNAMTSMLYM